MKQQIYCLDTYVIRDKDCISKCCASDNLIEKIHIAWQAGYEAVELWHVDVENYLSYNHTLQSLKKTIDNYKLQVPSYKVICNWMEMSEEEFIVNLPKFTNILETASNIGAKSCVLRMVHHTSNVHPTKKECIERCIKLLRIAETFSVRPSLEFMGNASCWNTLDSVLDIMKDIRHPLLALVLDTFHLFKSGDNNFTNFEKVALNPEQISVVHFTDARKDMPRDEQKDSDRRLPGLGQLNLKKFTTILNSLKFKGAYSLNVYDKSLWHRPPLEVAIEGFNKMANIISSPLE